MTENEIKNAQLLLKDILCLSVSMRLCTSPLTTDTAAFTWNCFHPALFTLQHPGCLRSTDPLLKLPTGADEVLDRWL